MKRSEALKVIKDVLIGGYDYPEQVILTKLEELGMLPPDTDNREDAVLDLPVYNVVCRQINGWDKE